MMSFHQFFVDVIQQFFHIFAIKMQQLQKYRFDQNVPLTPPYKEDGVQNSYYKGVNTETDKQVLISVYSEKKYQRLIVKHKRLLNLKQIRHTNIAEIYNVILDKQNKKLYAVLQWCAGGNLYDYEKSSGSIDSDVAIKTLLSLMEGLKAIHDGDEIHRHINMQNVQFDINGVPKLTFRCLYPKKIYMSPQDIQGNRSKQNDIFSLGVLFYKILLSQTPFKGNSLDEQIRMIQQGPRYPKDEQKMFPVSLPIEVKNLLTGMTMFKSNERWTDDAIIQQCKQYLKKMCQQAFQKPKIPQSLLKNILKNKYSPIFIRMSTTQENVIIALNPQKNQLTKFHIYRSKTKNALAQYVKNILVPYKKIQDTLEIVPIYQHSIIDDEYLVIRTFYDNQGSLKHYLGHSGTLTPEKSKTFIDQLTEKLKVYKETHNHLTDEYILIKGGIFYINYPPFLTKQYSNNLKNTKTQVGLIAPQVKQGKSSPNADAWSLAMLKYSLLNQQLPKFDKNGKAVIDKSKLPKDEAKFYEKFLVKDPKKRSDLFGPQKQPQAPPPPPALPPLVVKPSPQKKPKQNSQNQSQNQKKKVKEKDEIQQISLKLPVAATKDRQKTQINLPKPVPKQKGPRKTFGQLIAQKLYMFQNLQKHWTKPIRVGLKCLIGLIFLIFLYYWNFFLINGQLITEHSLYEQNRVLIRGFTSDSSPEISYNLVTKTPVETNKFFYNKTLSTLRDQYRCVLNDYSVESDVVGVINSSNFTTYQIFGILFTIINLIVFCVSLSKMDFPKVFFISKLDENNFNEIWNWVFINMALATQISFIYLLYGSLFHMKLQPCLSKATLTAVQFLLKKWNFSFNIRFIWIYLGLLFSYMVVGFFIIKPNYEVHRILKALLVGLYLAGTFCRIMGGSGGYVAWQKQSVFGKVGQLLLLIISVIYIVIDMIFGCNVKSEYATQINVNKVADNSQVDLNPTQENLLPE